MAIGTGDIKKLYSLPHIANMSFDETLQISAVELLGFDPLSNSLKRVTVNALGEYAVNDTEDVGSLTYVGKEDPDGGWIVQKIDSTTGTSIRYATIVNNPSVPDYTTAWAARGSSLTYGTYSQAF